MAKSIMISVKVAELTKPLTASRIKKGTLLSAFLEKKGIDYSSSIRVNAEVQKQDYRLKNGDIITVVGEVSGGV